MVPSISGPKRPQDKVFLTEAAKSFDKVFKENTKNYFVIEIDDKYHFQMLENQIIMEDNQLLQELQNGSY